MAAMPQVNTTYCPPERAVRFALRASEIRTDVRVILPLRGSDIEGLSLFRGTSTITYPRLMQLAPWWGTMGQVNV